MHFGLKQPKSTLPLTRLFAHSLAPLTHLLAPHYLLHLRAPLSSLVCSLARSLTNFKACGIKNDQMAIFSGFFSVLDHSAMAVSSKLNSFMSIMSVQVIICLSFSCISEVSVISQFSPFHYGTMLENSQEYKLKYRATRLSVRLFARTACFACTLSCAHLFARTAHSFAHSGLLTCSLARSLPCSWDSE